MSINSQQDLNSLMAYHKKYAKRGKKTWSEWILCKRTINLACMIIFTVSGIDFSDFELALYFRCDDPKVKKFLKSYEMQMEEAAIKPDRFVENLDSFCLKTCLYIEENHLYQDFFDFCELLEQQRRLKIQQGHKLIFDAYISLLMQQVTYFSRNRIEDSVAGVTDVGDLIFRKNPHPYSDLGCYELEKNYPAYLNGKKPITSDQIYRAYRPYGYEIHSMQEIEHLDAVVKVYDNNNYIMIPYINKRTLGIQVEDPYQHFIPDFPRDWKTTDFYQEKLLHRHYMLPASGITAEFHNAGDIKRIRFMEILYDNQVILLYRVTTYHNGEYSGYYRTKNQTFYSIFENTSQPEWHEKIKNFILENYMILTCDYKIDRKKNYAIKSAENLDNEFHYPNQPLVSFTYRKSGSSKKSSGKIKYLKEEYQEELRSRTGYIRNLPNNQHASIEAIQHAQKLGYELPEGKTFVRGHEYRIYRKVIGGL